MCFSDISVYQIPSHFRQKYTNLHQSYTNLANGLSLQRITCVIPLPGEII